MRAADLLPVFRMRQEDPRTVDVVERRARLLQRGFDDLKRNPRLLGRGLLLRADGTGTGDVNVIANANGARKANDRLVRRSSSDVSTCHENSFVILISSG